MEKAQQSQPISVNYEESTLSLIHANWLAVRQACECA